MTQLGQGARTIPAASGGLWLVGTNRRAHFYPGVITAKVGVQSACHHWTSTTLDTDEGPVDEWCEGCIWRIENGLTGGR